MQRAEKKFLYLPVETAARELDAKLLLALYAANQGFEVVLGNRALLNNAIYKFPPGIYLSHNFDKGRYRILKILKQLGHQLMAWDEEGLVWLNKQAYRNRRLFKPSAAQLEMIFAWGREHADNLTDITPKVIATGNPRADMLTPVLRKIYASKAKTLREQYGDYILINSNFGWLNYALDNASSSETLECRLQRLAEKSRHPLEYFRYRHEVFESFCALLPELSKRFADRQIIIRPHPSESPQSWQQAADGLANVSVRYDNDLIAWLMSAGAILHNGCTTAVESAMLGKCPIMYETTRDEKFDSAQPRAVSAIAENFEDVAKLIANPPKLSRQQEEAMTEMITGWGVDLSAPIIVGHMAKLYNPAKRPVHRLAGQALARFRKGQKKRAQSSPGSPSSMNYIDQKFPPVSVEQLQSQLKEMAELTGAVEINCPEITMLSDRIFKISMAEN